MPADQLPPHVPQQLLIQILQAALRGSLGFQQSCSLRMADSLIFWLWYQSHGLYNTAALFSRAAPSKLQKGLCIRRSPHLTL